MTWEEFKKLVEAAGVKNEDQIFYIDTGNDPYPEKLFVGVSKEGVEIH